MLLPAAALLDGIGGALVRTGTLSAATEPPELTTGMLVVSGIVLAALVLFVREPISLDVTVIAVTFAASMAFMTPMGTRRTAWRTGRGLRFVDYTRGGAPLQRLLAAVTVVGIWGIWGCDRAIPPENISMLKGTSRKLSEIVTTVQYEVITHG